MKIHLDYLEGRVEELENLNLVLEQDKRKADKKIIGIEDRLKKQIDEKEKEIQDCKAREDNMEERLQELESRNKDIVDKYEREIEMYNSVNNLS